MEFLKFILIFFLNDIIFITQGTRLHKGMPIPV